MEGCEVRFRGESQQIPRLEARDDNRRRWVEDTRTYSAAVRPSARGLAMGAPPEQGDTPMSTGDSATRSGARREHPTLDIDVIVSAIESGPETYRASVEVWLRNEGPVVARSPAVAISSDFPNRWEFFNSESRFGRVSEIANKSFLLAPLGGNMVIYPGLAVKLASGTVVGWDFDKGDLDLEMWAFCEGFGKPIVYRFDRKTTLG